MSRSDQVLLFEPVPSGLVGPFGLVECPTGLADHPSGLVGSPPGLVCPASGLVGPPSDLAGPPSDLAGPPSDLAGSDRVLPFEKRVVGSFSEFFLVVYLLINENLGMGLDCVLKLVKLTKIINRQ